MTLAELAFACHPPLSLAATGGQAVLVDGRRRGGLLYSEPCQGRGKYGEYSAHILWFDSTRARDEAQQAISPAESPNCINCSWNLSLKLRSAVGHVNKQLRIRNAPIVS